MYAKAYICFMEYTQHHLLQWITSHSCLNLSCIEKECELPKDTLRHFAKDRRMLTDNHYSKLCQFLANYGFVRLESE